MLRSHPLGWELVLEVNELLALAGLSFAKRGTRWVRARSDGREWWRCLAQVVSCVESLFPHE